MPKKIYENLTAEEIRDILPHRYPFLLVDRVVEVTRPEQEAVGAKIVGYKAVTQNEPFFQGHFPGHPVMPGVLILEALAQVTALLVFRYILGGKKDYDVYLASVDNAKFRHPVIPGDLLRLEGEIVKVRSQKFWMVKCQAFVENKKESHLSCEAQMCSVMVKKEESK